MKEIEKHPKIWTLCCIGICVTLTSNGNQIATRNVEVRKPIRNSGFLQANKNFQSAVSIRESLRLNNTNNNYEDFPSTSTSTLKYVSNDGSNDSDIFIYVESPKCTLMYAATVLRAEKTKFIIKKKI